MSLKDKIALAIIVFLIILIIISYVIRSTKIKHTIKTERIYTIPHTHIVTIPYQSGVFKSSIFTLIPQPEYHYECIETEYYSGKKDITIVGTNGQVSLRAYLLNTTGIVFELRTDIPEQETKTDEPS